MDLQSLIGGLFGLSVGLPTLLFPREKRLAAEAKTSARQAKLAEGAEERFFEERRTLQAYPLPNADWKWRARGALLTACGIALLLLSYFREAA